MVELPAASGILELRTERRSDVAIDPLRLSAVDRVAQPGMATQSPCMLTRTSSGTLGYLDGLFGPPWVIKGRSKASLVPARAAVRGGAKSL